MKALTYHGSKDVRVETVADPKIVDPDDIILRVTATAICGSDLHIYRGKIPMIYRVLAAAYGESGRFADAVETAQRGVELANNQGNPALAAELKSNIALYQSGRPLRDPSITNGSSSP